MKVFKFGGASVKDAEAVRNATSIVKQYATEQPLLVVVSAMGKTTNVLETLLNDFLANNNFAAALQDLRAYHWQIALDLFGSETYPAFEQLEAMLLQLERALLQANVDKYDESYDQVVGLGEVLATIVVAAYFAHVGIACQWLDAREYIRTDPFWREGQVDWTWSEKLIQNGVQPILQHQSVVTQGFIGGTVGQRMTTLGREGSDFSAAIFAYCLQADSLTIWKDVPGILNADPKRLTDTRLYTQLSYNEAAEMTYYGATVIHPKTIKPLANRNIPLYVRSFVHPQEAGTEISQYRAEQAVPAIIFKPQQCLISFGVRDFTFITEKNLSTILHALASLHIKINLMQNSAISFSVCTDQSSRRLAALREALQDDFAIYFNENLLLVTIKPYDESTIQRVVGEQEILLEQRTRHTYQAVLREATP